MMQRQIDPRALIPKVAPHLVQWAAIGGLFLVCFLGGLGLTRLMQKPASMVTAKLESTPKSQGPSIPVTPRTQAEPGPASAPQDQTAGNDRRAQARKAAESHWQTEVMPEPAEPALEQRSLARPDREATEPSASVQTAQTVKLPAKTETRTGTDTPLQPVRQPGSAASETAGTSAAPAAANGKATSGATDATTDAAQTASSPLKSAGAQSAGMTSAQMKSAQAKSGQTKPADTKSADAKPAEAEPADTKPAGAQAAELGAFADLPVVQAAVAAAALGTSASAGAVTTAAAAIAAKPRAITAWAMLGEALIGVEQPEAAEIALNRALTLPKPTDDDKGAAGAATGNLAALALRRGDVTAGTELTRKSIEIHRDLGRYDAIMAAYMALANHHVINRDPAKAEAVLGDAIAQADQDRQGGAVLQAQQRLAELALSQRQFEKADQLFQSALQSSHALGLPESMADQYASLGLVWAARGDRVEAETYWRAAKDQYEQLGLTVKAQTVTALLRASSPTALRSPSQPTTRGGRG